MKKIYLLLIVISGLLGNPVYGQYTLTGYTTSVTATPDCDTILATFRVTVSAYSSSLWIRAYYGTGETYYDSVRNSGTNGYLNCRNNYARFGPGKYSLKFVLFNGATAIDSLFGSYYNSVCNTMKIVNYFDKNSNCLFDTGDMANYWQARIEVDSSGVPIDTLYSLSSYEYPGLGPIGTSYTFKILSTPAGSIVTCPASGVLYDTIHAVSAVGNVHYFGFECSSTPIFDNQVNAFAKFGRHRCEEFIYPISVCSSSLPVVVMNCSPKYHYQRANPTPTSVVGNVVTWNLATVVGYNGHSLWASYDVPGPWLIPGDTVHSGYWLTSMVGDIDHGNDTVIVVDTVTGSWDPNEITVTPSGYINAGTQLEYAIQFENTGNDTAHNIHVMDTLSDQLDLESFRIVSSSHKMDLALLKNYGGHNIVKFDFPDINLLDSSHHGECDGILYYTIKTKNGLPFGTHIDNRAGIYFDDNDVVMTNTVENIIGWPAETKNLNQNYTNLFPNPVTDELTIKADIGDYNLVSIRNTVGQELITKELTSAETKVDVKAFPAGIYFVTLRGEAGVKVQQLQKY